MSKILAVFGATGQQGSSVVNYVLNDPELSTIYKIRAITRDINSEKARQLAKRVEVVQGDISDPVSLKTALTGVHTIFGMTTPSFGPNAIEDEFHAGKSLADAVVASGAHYLIFSTLPPVKDISRGKYSRNTTFQAKAAAEKYIRSLSGSIQSAFYSPAGFMENFTNIPALAPRKREDGTYVLSRAQGPSAKMLLVDAVGNTGNFVGAILAEPEKYEGKTFCAASGWYSLEEIAAVMSKSAGKTVVYQQVSTEEFRKNLSDMLPVPLLVDMVVDMFEYQQEFGYYGQESERLVAWARENARGELTTLEEYFEKHPLVLA